MTIAAELPAVPVSKSAVIALLIALTYGTSSIAFKEPAPTDLLMAMAIVAVPLLGQGRLGLVTILNLVMWLALVALGLIAAPMSTAMESAIPHQIVTLFLAGGAVTTASYIAADPEPRFHLVMKAYVVASVIASLAAFLGYFGIFKPDLFTLYGRACGTFKDPNVMSASLVPAIAYCTWMTLRSRPFGALVSAGITLFLSLALLLTFSRGAWAATLLAIMMIVWFSIITTRENRHVVRFLVVTILGIVALAAGLGAMMKSEAVVKLLSQRATLDQSYDNGPDGRFGGHDKAEKLILDNPFGLGTHAFRTSYHHEEVHNVYLTQFLNAGWIGGLLFVTTTVMTLILGLRGALMATPLQPAFIIATASFGAIAFEGIVIDSDHWRFLFMLMGLLWGLSDAALMKTYLRDETAE